MKITIKNKFKIFLLLILVISCEDYENNDEIINDNNTVQKILDIPEGFEYSTHRSVNLNINDKEDNIIYEFYIYSKENETEDNLKNDEIILDNKVYKKIISGITINKKIQHNINISNNINEVCLRRKSDDGYFYKLVSVENNIVTYNHINNSNNKSVTNKSAQITNLGAVINQDTYITGNAIRSGNFNSKGYKLEVTGDLSISGQLNLKNSNSNIIANKIIVSGTVLLKGGTITSHSSIVISGWLDGSGTVNYCTTKTITGSLNTSGQTVQQQCGTDTDGDGVNDPDDAYPNDNEKAFQIYTPSSSGKSTLAFEDLWPSTVDYDFNDLSFSYRTLVITNADNNAVQIDFICNVKSYYAGFTNAFGIELEGVTPSQVESISGTNITESYLTFNSNGTEAGQDNAVIIFSDNADNFITETTVSVILNTPISTSTLGAAPFNPFIIANQERGREIHLSGYNKTNLGNNGTYITETGLPWGLSIINEDFDVPKDGISIIDAYNYFDDWATSGGSSYIDWYSDNPGYRNADKIDD